MTYARSARPILKPRWLLASSLLTLSLAALCLPACSSDDPAAVPGASGGAGTESPGSGGIGAGLGGHDGSGGTPSTGIDPDSPGGKLVSVEPSDTAGKPQDCSPAMGAASNTPAESDVSAPSQPLSEFIVVDQFGYPPESEKVAVLRDPVTELGQVPSTKDYTPSATYRLMDASTNSSVFEGAATAWNGGAEHEQSGDKAWWFDFSSVTTPGVYYVLDVDNDVRSDVFRIAPDVYREMMKHAVRTFFYQRAGFAKTAPFAENDWIDGASHIGTGQDKEARLYGSTGDASTARDVSGGWYDAGDYNKYTPWTSDYVVEMLRAYSERPTAFGDDYNLPDSGNCVADLLDEAVFGLEHLVRLQLDDGSVISVIGLDGASPPSAATGDSTYGPPTTNASLRAAMAYAWGARVLAEIHPNFAAGLMQRAIDAYAWADAHPDVKFNNSGKVAAGEQQSSDSDIAIYKLGAALALYRLTGDAVYKSYFDVNHFVQEYNAFNYSWLGAYQLAFTDIYLDYTTLPDADATVSEAILGPVLAALAGDNNLGNLSSEMDPYMARHDDMTWGSNSIRCRAGLQQYTYVSYGLDAAKEADATRAASRYVHYIHGVNPLQLVYLSQMERFGSHKSVTTLYHTWFHDGSSFDTNPAPGFLVGGPNSSYDWDSCCNDNSCGGDENNALCANRPGDGPTSQGGDMGQWPAMKAYWEFNDSWPVNSWAVTENSDGYQLAYIRLLSKFVN